MKCKDIQKFLADIEQGIITLELADNKPEDVYCGDVYYIASNGYIIIIFNDCNEWDYIDSIIDTEDCYIYEFGDSNIIDSYEPSVQVAKERYYFP
jgi:hypothetical protein